MGYLRRGRETIMANGIDRVLRDFIVESQENLERLDHELVALEHEPDNAELLDDIFRTIHTIKGSAGFLNLLKLEQVSHQAEDVLSKLRKHELTLNSEIVTALLQAIDFIKSTLLFLEKNGQEGDVDVTDLVSNLKKAAEGETIEALDTPVKLDLEEASVADQPETPPEKSLQDSSTGNAESDDSKPAPAPDTQEPATLGVEDSRIHVDVQLLDQLMNLTGELVLSRNQVVQLATNSEQKVLRDVAQRMNLIVAELQETVMKTRMQQLKKVLGSFPRLVRDISKLHGKNVQLFMEGQNTELDRTLIEAIKDPLTHLVRNAIDHGIEQPETRAKLGKPPIAKISINAYHEGGLVNIEISDDGAGIDLERIKAKAIKEGLITAHQAEEMNERNLLGLIFRPGFSTAEKVTKISGRGVGMDVVKRNLDRIGGTIDIQTEFQQGTTVKIRIPITLAIIPVLIVTSGNQRFAIPQVNLEELIMLQDGSNGIEKIYGAEVYRLRGELLPLLRLNELLQLTPATTETHVQEGFNIVVLSAGDALFGLIVDDVGDTQEIVVKPLSSHVKQLDYYDGATIMGDGSVALILNVNGVFRSTQISLEDMQKAEQESVEAIQETAETREEDQKQTIVLFRVGEHEYYGVPLAFVVRLEEFSASQIEYSGGREVMQYREEILPLIRLEDYLDIPEPPKSETLSLIVFSVEKQIGLVVTEIVNTIEISTHIDTETFKQKGILGSTIVQGHSVLILDIHGLIEMAYPNWYKKFFVSKLTEDERENIRVLLVEDSMFFQNIEKSYLEAAGYHVITADHGNEALEKLEEHHIDVVVTDIDMPYCDGYELTKTIKSKDIWKHLPVMAVTALSGEEDRRKGIEAGIDEYQVKLDRDEVLKVLEQMILRKRKEMAAIQ
ncbi:response regulator [candidate division KSB3 bacterium]|uniref:histidine kinase n=1 Tax=candidate division KSB3 bacterium TaxID=2044937 RepID=A0A9D5K0I3_9BACT|nr:response regulator [candidate division KSB3 bacterium]MBD3327146.1 response regulator [candidate division KSB3 bacterium]